MQIEVTDPSFNLASYSEVDVNGDPVYGSIPFQIVAGNGRCDNTGIDIDLKEYRREPRVWLQSYGHKRWPSRRLRSTMNQVCGGQILSGLDPQSARPCLQMKATRFTSSTPALILWVVTAPSGCSTITWAHRSIS